MLQSKIIYIGSLAEIERFAEPSQSSLPVCLYRMGIQGNNNNINNHHSATISGEEMEKSNKQLIYCTQEIVKKETSGIPAQDVLPFYLLNLVGWIIRNKSLILFFFIYLYIYIYLLIYLLFKLRLCSSWNFPFPALF